MADEYNDFWFVETRNQPNNLKRWIIYIIILVVFVSAGKFVMEKAMYTPIKDYDVKSVSGLEIKVDEAKKTADSGYIKGTIKNTTKEAIKGKYIMAEFYTKNKVNEGKEYIEIGTIEPDEEKTFEMKFKYSNIERFTITITDNKEKEEKLDIINDIKEHVDINEIMQQTK